MKALRIEFYAVVLTVVVLLAGCGGTIGKSGVSPVSVVSTGNGSGGNLSGEMAAAASGTARTRTAAEYVGIPAPDPAAGSASAIDLTNATTFIITSSTKGMSFQDLCGASAIGQASAFKETIWLSMATTFCWKFDGLVEFDITQLMDIVPENIALVELQLYEFNSFGHQGAPWLYNFEVAAYPNTNSWDEASAWYGNQPGYNTSFTGNKIVITSELGWKTWTVTDIVKKWTSGETPNYGFRLAPLNSGAPDDSNVFMYDEAAGAAQTPSLAPRLVVYIKEPAPVDLNGDGIPDTTDMCPGLSAPPNKDADLNGCQDTIAGLRILIQNMDTSKPVIRSLNSLAQKAEIAIQGGNTGGAVKLLGRMSQIITKDKGKTIPTAKANMLLQYIKNIISAL